MHEETILNELIRKTEKLEMTQHLLRSIISAVYKELSITSQSSVFKTASDQLYLLTADGEKVMHREKLLAELNRLLKE